MGEETVIRITYDGRSVRRFHRGLLFFSTLVVMFVFWPGMPDSEELRRSPASISKGIRNSFLDQNSLCRQLVGELRFNILGLYGQKQDFKITRKTMESVISSRERGGGMVPSLKKAYDEVFLGCAARKDYQHLMDKIAEKVYPRRFASL